MIEPKEEEEQGILPRPPAAAINYIVPALPQLLLRSPDSGVDDEKAPPHSSMSPPANEMAVTSSTSSTNTASATLALL
jgi:hypothetical protein